MSQKDVVVVGCWFVSAASHQQNLLLVDGVLDFFWTIIMS
jgi:hypothetical protein